MLMLLICYRQQVVLDARTPHPQLLRRLWAGRSEAVKKSLVLALMEQVEVGEPVVPVNREPEVGSSFVWVSQPRAGVYWSSGLLRTAAGQPPVGSQDNSSGLELVIKERVVALVV